MFSNLCKSLLKLCLTQIYIKKNQLRLNIYDTFVVDLESVVCILAIESSCDDTSASIILDGKVKSNVVSSQKIHEAYGGVVPELASRSHEKNIIPVVQEAMKQAGVELNQLSAIAFTAGPGLIGSLLVGVTFAKGLALSLNIPLIEVNHLQAHVMAHFIDEPTPQFPFLCLLISGGHTQIIEVQDYLHYHILGETHDDAAGEAFDKTAKILGLPYPGGPLIDHHSKEGNSLKFKFPIPKSSDLDFSFSGFKTSVLYYLQKERAKDPNFVENNLADLCASIQYTIAEILFQKFELAIRNSQSKQVALAGGVAANSYIRKRFDELSRKFKVEAFIPQFQYCTDNAGMIAITAHYMFLNHQFTSQQVVPFARQKS